MRQLPRSLKQHRPLLALALLAAAGLAGCAVDTTSDLDLAPDVVAGSGTTTLSGTIGAGKWVNRSFDIAQPSDLEAVLTWVGTATSPDLNLFLYDPSGANVASSNGTSRPETVTYSGGAGTYRLGIKNLGTTSTSYTIALTITPTTPTPTSKALLGMSAPVSDWAQRVQDVGPGLQARRIFYGDFSATLNLAQQAIGDGMTPVLSFKTGSYSWAQVAAGNADAALHSLATRLAALGAPVYVVIHHEPEKDGTQADWSAMQAHALPLLKSANVRVGVIGNGWWFSSTNQGKPDSYIGAWITPTVIQISDFIGADTYQLSANDDDPGVKMRRMGEWARRVGGVKALGIGEFNAITGAAVTSATNALAADPLFAFGCVWNANGGIATVLTGDRLTAFRTALANW